MIYEAPRNLSSVSMARAKMSDHITVNGKLYFEVGYIHLANKNVKRRGNRIIELETELAAVTAERDRLAAALRGETVQNKLLADKCDLAGSMAHVIVQHGVIPGVADTCRCEECRSVALSMTQAGFLDHIDDRWWECSGDE